jgi:hypothetical protein
VMHQSSLRTPTGTYILFGVMSDDILCLSIHL